jgi:multicomponent Na+:H+ antiporter subunit C
MEIIIALCIGVLYSGGMFLILQRSLVRLIIGIILLGNGANLLIFLLGRISKGTPPIIPEGSSVITDVYSDPIPQALILTAIVISFGLQAFAIILIKRAYRVVKTDDLMQFDTKEF